MNGESHRLQSLKDEEHRAYCEWVIAKQQLERAQQHYDDACAGYGNAERAYNRAVAMDEQYRKEQDASH